MIDEATISLATDRLKAAAPPGSEVVMFGSHARGDAGGDSDVDFLVIEPTSMGKWEEQSRLQEAVGPIGTDLDLVVVGRAEYDRQRGTPNNLMYEVSRHVRQEPPPSDHKEIWVDQTRELRQKAEMDERMMLAVIDRVDLDEPIGFHAQQAVEKLLKALLNHRREAYSPTHNLTQLLGQLESSGPAIPTEMWDIGELQPYAVVLRYVETNTPTLDRQWAKRMVRFVADWVDAEIVESG